MRDSSEADEEKEKVACRLTSRRQPQHSSNNSRRKKSLDERTNREHAAVNVVAEEEPGVVVLGLVELLERGDQVVVLAVNVTEYWARELGNFRLTQQNDKKYSI